MDRDDRVLAIVLAAEHFLRLAGIDLCRQLVERSVQILDDRLAGFRPFDKHGEILGTTTQRVTETAIVLETPPPLQQFLGGRLIFPEIRFRDALFYLGEFFRGAGCVKDSSADRSRGARVPGICEAVRRVARPNAVSFIDAERPIVARDGKSPSIANHCHSAGSRNQRERRDASNAAAVIASESHATRSPIRV
jgi:hypothetical protein